MRITRSNGRDAEGRPQARRTDASRPQSAERVTARLGNTFMKKIALAAMATMLMAGTAHAQSGNTASADGEATVTVVSPITLTHVDGAVLNFGTITVGTGGSVLVSAADGTATAPGDVAFVSGSTTSADAFTVTGDPDRGFDITADNGVVTRVGFTETMAVRTDLLSATGALDNTGNASFNVGGRLTVTGTEPAGVYEGTYNVTVTYN